MAVDCNAYGFRTAFDRVEIGQLIAFGLEIDPCITLDTGAGHPVPRTAYHRVVQHEIR